MKPPLVRSISSIEGTEGKGTWVEEKTANKPDKLIEAEKMETGKVGHYELPWVQVVMIFSCQNVPFPESLKIMKMYVASIFSFPECFLTYKFNHLRHLKVVICKCF